MLKSLNLVRSRKGFTLIELLIVIAIIAILAVVIILNVTSARRKAAEAKAKDDTNEIVKIIGACNADGGTVVTTYAAGVSICSGSDAEVTGNYPTSAPPGWIYLAGTSAEFMDAVFDDDKNGTATAGERMFDCSAGGCTDTVVP